MRVTGFIQTSHEVEPDEVFEIVQNPPSRLARVGPADKVLEPWRRQAMLDDRYKATRIAWALDARLFPGIVLHPDLGLPTWKAEQAIDGLMQGEPYFVENVTGLLARAKGVVLVLPGDLRALIVRESYFASGAIEIGGRLYFSELAEAEELPAPGSEGYRLTAQEHDSEGATEAP
jgi:hypothetical protein